MDSSTCTCERKLTGATIYVCFMYFLHLKTQFLTAVTSSFTSSLIRRSYCPSTCLLNSLKSKEEKTLDHVSSIPCTALYLLLVTELLHDGNIIFFNISLQFYRVGLSSEQAAAFEQDQQEHCHDVRRLSARFAIRYGTIRYRVFNVQ